MGVQEEAIAVKTPPGIEEGLALRVPGHGEPSPTPGGAPGDLHGVVYSAPDPRFERRGADRWHTEVSAVLDASLGTSYRLVVQVQLPEKLRRQERALYPQLRARRKSEVSIGKGRMIVANAGQDGGVIIERVREAHAAGKATTGYDVLANKYCDMVEAGITDIPEPEKAPPTPGGEYGEMM